MLSENLENLDRNGVCWRTSFRPAPGRMPPLNQSGLVFLNMFRSANLGLDPRRNQDKWKHTTRCCDSALIGIFAWPVVGRCSGRPGVLHLGLQVALHRVEIPYMFGALSNGRLGAARDDQYALPERRCEKPRGHVRRDRFECQGCDSLHKLNSSLGTCRLVLGHERR